MIVSMQRRALQDFHECVKGNDIMLRVILLSAWYYLSP